MSNTPSTRDCHIGLKIGSGNEINLETEKSIYLLESPNFTIAPIRDYDTQEYPESAAAEMDGRTTFKPFDYKMSLCYFGNETTANSVIRTFFDSLFTVVSGNDVRTAQELQIKNYWKGVKMNGYAKQWDGKTYSIQGEAGVIAFDLTIYVKDPTTFTAI